MSAKRKSAKKVPKIEEAVETGASPITSREAGSGPAKPDPASRDFAGQIVEVVEETAPQMEPAAEEDVQTDAPSEMPAGRQEMPQEEEKRKEMVDDLFDEKQAAIMPEIAVHTKSAVIPFVSWVLVVLSVAAVTGGVLYIAIQRPTLRLPALFFVKPTPTPTPIPTPTPAAVKREDVSIQILNGGGTPGAAGKMKKLLEDKGYSVKDVGNTDEYTHTKTEILVKSGKEAYLGLLETDLKDVYLLGTSSATLPADAAYDVRVIVGKE
ncbi:LytR C-terminal domain-containing protein [Candidatus Gottesmanbacteria bacterium]|nr:LytR C-terminal domain-containing protein [Candidatus Gottesmanbacteria bacterium]